MQLTVLGGGGAWPTPERGCSGYLVEEAGFRLLIDPGPATVPELLRLVAAADVDAVFVSHGHADHCADLNALLRARQLTDDPAGPLAVYALAGALDAVLALDGPLLTSAYRLHEFAAGDELTAGPFRLHTRRLRHSVPNVGVRIGAGDTALVYTGDGCADPEVIELARGAQVLLAEATFVDDVPDGARGFLGSARSAGAYAAAADVGQLVLTHLSPGIDPAAAELAAGAAFTGPIAVARPGLRIAVR